MLGIKYLSSGKHLLFRKQIIVTYGIVVEILLVGSGFTFSSAGGIKFVRLSLSCA